MSEETLIPFRIAGTPNPYGAELILETENGIPRGAYLNGVKIPALFNIDVKGMVNQVVTATFTIYVKQIIHRELLK
jgi:hypothetical protein